MCLGQNLSYAQQAIQYQLAFQRIWTIFHQVGATNVGFVWSVSTARHNTPLDPAAFYPGNRYVDWIAADGTTGLRTTRDRVRSPISSPPGTTSSFPTASR